METGKKPISLRLVSAIIIFILGANLLTFYVVSSHDDQSTGMQQMNSEYRMEDPLIDQQFRAASKYISVDNQGTQTKYKYSLDGLAFTYRSRDDVLLLREETRAENMVLTLDTSKLMERYYARLVFEIIFSVGDDCQYLIQLDMSRMNTTVNYTLVTPDGNQTVYGDLIYDVTDCVSLMTALNNGQIRLGVNGIEDRATLPVLEHWNPRFESVKILPKNKYTCDQQGVVRKLQLGSYQINYVDTLHKTIVPDGMDFAFSLHVHADRTYPQQLNQMANLSHQYGLKGTYDAWVEGSPYVYGMEDAQYTAAMHNLQDSGWGLGVHAFSYNRDLTTNQSEEALDIFTEEFGTPTTWSDHGARLQDLSQNGSDPNSPYYVGDVVRQIGAAWWNNRSHSHSSYNDLNVQGLSYHFQGREDLPLFRVSQMQSQLMFMQPGREDNLDRYLRAWPMERSVIVSHDYMPYFFYVENATGSYSIYPEHDDIQNTPWGQLAPKLVFVGDDWYPLPRFERFLNWTTGYDVWFATVREIVDRSAVVQQIEVTEDNSKVTIKNPTDQPLKGFTLFTKAEPNYQLNNEGKIYLADKGTGKSWHFVIDLDANSTIVLFKETESPYSYDLELANDHGNALVERERLVARRR